MPATYEPIATTTLGGNQSTIVFSSIPTTYTDLRLIVVGTTNDSNANFALRLNGDTGANYGYASVFGNGSSANSFSSTNNTGMFIGAVGTGNSTTIPTLLIVDIFSYTGSTRKTVLAGNSFDNNSTGETTRTVSLWKNTSAINSVTLYTAGSTTTFKANTTATLYGIKAA